MHAGGTKGRVPALDGVRGAALLGVLFFHAGAVLPGGYLGVDLFFTLSGFLITSSLVAELRDKQTISLARFWKRRARRLLPAIFPVVVAVALYAAFMAGPDELANLRRDAFGTLAYISNWQNVFSERSYWQLFAQPSPLAHTWSLSIEEQFYLTWPLLVLLFRRSEKALFGVTIALVIGSAALAWKLWDPLDDARVYFGTDTRAGAILAGAALAIVTRGPRTVERRFTRIALDLLTIVAAGYIGLGWWRFGKNDSMFLYRGGLALIQLATVFLIWSTATRAHGIVSRFFSLRPLRFVGEISYGAYLWHWPIFVVVSQLRMPFPHMREPLAFALVFAFATLSYRWLEQPILRGDLTRLRVHFALPASYVACIAALLVTTRERPALAQTEAPRPMFGAPTRIMFVGDSTANVLAWMVKRSRRNVWVDSFAHDGCDMRADNCGGDKWRTDTDTLRPEATILFLGGAFLYGNHDETGKFLRPCDAQWDEAFRTHVAARLPQLERPGTQLWVASVPYALGKWDGPANRREVDCINASLRTVLADHPEVRVLDMAEKICPKGQCVTEMDGRILRPDGVHFAPQAKSIANWVVDSVAERD